MKRLVFMWLFWYSHFLQLVTTSVSGCQRPDRPVEGFYKPSKDTYSHGEKVQYFCNAGYTRMGKDTRFCEFGGKWSGQTPFCDSRTKLKNPEATSFASTPSNSVYKVADNSTNSCFSTEDRTGQSLKIYLSEVAVINVVRLFLPKGHVNLIVNSGYRRNQEMECSTVNQHLGENQWVTLTCALNLISNYIIIKEQSSGRRALTICEVEVYVKDDKWCSEPPNIYISNGHLLVSREKTILQCATGYKEKLYTSLVCTKSQTWEGGILECIEILCNRIRWNGNGDWHFVGNVNKLAVGVVKQLKCEGDHILKGSPDKVTCMPNGTWTHSNVTCVGKQNSELKAVVIAVSVVACALIVSCLGFIAFLVLRKKFAPVVVVLKPGETTYNMQPCSTTERYNESEYSSVLYDAMPSIGNFSELPKSSQNNPPVRIIQEYVCPSDHNPPPYNSNETYAEPL